VKTSINIDDGVIDVDVRLPDFVTSFESAVSSPSSSGYLSASGFCTGLDAFEHSCRFSPDGDMPLNVAGWLQQYHPDFLLQALPAQDGIIEQIKASMRVEPSPPQSSSAKSTGSTAERWVDVSSAVVADTTTFNITRIRYRRLVKPKPGGDRNAASTTPSHMQSSPTPLTTQEVQLREEFIEEPIVCFDDVLIEAVEKVMAADGAETVSKASSENSSRSASKRRKSTSVDSEMGHHPPSTIQGSLMVPQEVPRSKCKTVVLSALEDIIQDVIAEREQEQEQDHDGAQGESLVREGIGGEGRQRRSRSERAAAAFAARERESPLREAVRAWIESVDLGD
jgi:hypothetical protein